MTETEGFEPSAYIRMTLTRGVAVGVFSISLSTLLFTILTKFSTSFPLTPFSLIKYANNLNNSIWLLLLFSCSMSAAASRIVWFSLKDNPQFQNIDSFSSKTFGKAVVRAFIILLSVVLLRELVAIVAVFSALALLIIIPIIMIAAYSEGLEDLGGEDVGRIHNIVLISGLSLLFTINWIIFTIGEPAGVVTPLFGLVYVMLLTGYLPYVLATWEVIKQSDGLESHHAKVRELDTILANTNYDRLSAHDLELPYQRARIRTQPADQHTLACVSLNKEQIDDLIKYYQAIQDFETELATILRAPDASAAVTNQLGQILTFITPKQPKAPMKERIAIVNSATEILAAYPLLRLYDYDATSELEQHLADINDVGADDVASEETVTTLQEAFTTVEDWASNRASTAQQEAQEEAIQAKLEMRLESLKDDWETQVLTVFPSDVNGVRPYPDSISDAQASQNQLETVFDTTERIVSLATAVENLETNYPTHFTGRTTDAFGEYLIQSHQEKGMSERLTILEDAIEVIGMALSSQERYTPPFNTIAKQLIADVQDKSITQQEISTARAIVDNSVTILSFLKNIDSSHPSVYAEDWYEKVQIALTNFSPDILNPPVSQIERIENTLWEPHHLMEFSWDEFEHLIGSLFEARGYDTQVTQEASDEGVDVWAQDKTTRIAIQVKQFSPGNTVGRPPLQKISSAIAKGDADQAMVVTSSEFTSTATTYEADFPKLQLVNGDQLIQMLSEAEIPPPV